MFPHDRWPASFGRHHRRRNRAASYHWSVVGITGSIDVSAPVAAVWRDIADLASHAEWMAEADVIEFLDDRREGVGTRMRVMTSVGPLRTADILEITEWNPPASIGVAHRGVVSGTGRFTLTSLDTGTRFTWSETLSLPWRLGGPVAELVARPVLAAIWKRNLARFRDRF